MKLTKKDRKALETALENLTRGRDFIMKADTLVCRRKGMATTSLDLTNEYGDCAVAIDKEIGSDLAILWTGINQLQKLLSASA